MLFRILLAVLGFLLERKSRNDDGFRRQLSRDLVFEISSDDGVARHFVFRDRRISSHAGHSPETPACTLRFSTAGQGLAVFTTSDGPQRMLDGLLAGTVRIEGNTPLAGWFQGLATLVVPGAKAVRLPATPPGAYLRPASSPEVSRFITREPVADALDPAWREAVEARKKLLMTRVADGEPLKPF